MPGAGAQVAAIASVAFIWIGWPRKPGVSEATIESAMSGFERDRVFRIGHLRVVEICPQATSSARGGRSRR